MARIMVVDDELAICTTLSVTLQQAGYDVCVARDCTEALELSRTGLLDLVITDIHMPKQDGLSVIRDLRQAHPQLKIIAMTGGSLSDYLRWASKLGADLVMAKPFTSHAILDAVAGLLTHVNRPPPKN